MGRPSKSAEIIVLEGKSHRTKKEIAYRREKEKDTITKKPLQPTTEVKENTRAFAEFKRVKGILKIIGKDDALFGAVINRYCLLISETADLEKTRGELQAQVRDLEQNKKKYKLDEYLELYALCLKTIAALDRNLKSKRDQLFTIEKENGMTIAAALRSVPKKPETGETRLRKVLNG